MEPERQFLSVNGRRVHLWRTGDGPPALLIHSSPANARLLRPEMDALADRFTLFAFDTPGFGQSDPIPSPNLEIADLADATAEAMAAAGLPACPVYGTHTGAAVALELAVRHPDRVTGLVLDGLPMFTPGEIARNFGDYFRPLPVTDLGGVYSEVWTRFRDQATWFPWSQRQAVNLNDYDLSSPASTHRWVSMYFEAAAHYTPAYRAALNYGPRAAAAVAELERPAVFTATETDMLHPHLDRLPPLKAGQQIEQIGRSHRARLDLIATAFTRFGADGPPPRGDRPLQPSTSVQRRFLTTSTGQIHLRHCGDPAAGRPILLIHDAPGSSAWIEPQIAALGKSCFVIAPDLPGHGDSLALAEPSLDAFAAALSELVATAVGAPATIVGLGFGSALAMRFAVRFPHLAGRVVLCGAPLPDDEERAELCARLAPPIEIAEDGSHWYRTWLMLRDAQVWWPWFKRRRDAQRGVDMNLTAAELHARTVDVMGQPDSYGHLALAALAADMRADLGACQVPLAVMPAAPVPLSVHDRRLREACPAAEVLSWDSGLSAVAERSV